MITSDLDDIKALCIRFRAAVERTPSEELPGSFEHFPRGCCDDASQLLGAFLQDQGFDSLRAFSGTRGAGQNWTTHAWLRSGSIDIDITADQFPDAPGAVVVEKDSTFHRTFTVDERGVPDFRRHVDEDWKTTATRAYTAILSTIGAA